MVDTALGTEKNLREMKNVFLILYAVKQNEHSVTPLKEKMGKNYKQLQEKTVLYFILCRERLICKIT